MKLVFVMYKDTFQDVYIKKGKCLDVNLSKEYRVHTTCTNIFFRFKKLTETDFVFLIY